MSEKEKPKNFDPLNPFQVTNKVIGFLGKGLVKGVGAVAKAGHEAYTTARNESIEKQSVEEIHDIMYAGGLRPTPGHPLPTPRITALTHDELSKFTGACNRLIDRGIDLPKYVTDFAGRFYIKLKK